MTNILMLIDLIRARLLHNNVKVLFLALACAILVLFYVLHYHNNEPQLVIIPDCDVRLTHGNHEAGFCHEVITKLDNCYGEKAGNIGAQVLPNFYTSELWKDPDLLKRFRNSSVAFVHLPKTGGTSMEALIKDFLVTEDCQYESMRMSHCAEFFDSVVNQKRSQMFFWSKRTFGLHKYLLNQKGFIYVTWFRDPVTRFISTYYYLRLMKPWYNNVIIDPVYYYVLKMFDSTLDYRFLTHKYVGESLDISDFITKSKNVIIPDFDNYIVRLLQDGEFPEIAETFEDCCGAYMFSSGLSVPEVTEEHYHNAKNNLENLMSFVGLTEDFSTSQAMLCDMFELPCAELTYNVNTNKHKETVSADDLAEIQRRNFWDLKLYEDAKIIYEKQKIGHAKFTRNDE